MFHPVTAGTSRCPRCLCTPSHGFTTLAPDSGYRWTSIDQLLLEPAIATALGPAVASRPCAFTACSSGPYHRIRYAVPINPHSCSAGAVLVPAERLSEVSANEPRRRHPAVKRIVSLWPMVMGTRFLTAYQVVATVERRLGMSPAPSATRPGRCDVQASARR